MVTWGTSMSGNLQIKMPVKKLELPGNDGENIIDTIPEELF